MSKRTIAGARVSVHRAAGLGRIDSQRRAASASAKIPQRMTSRKLKRMLCGADCESCRACEYGKEWLRRQEQG